MTFVQEMRGGYRCLSILVAWFVLCSTLVSAFSSERNDNLAVYWGQDSANNQQRLSFYCEDDTIDAIPLAFLYIFFGAGGMPVIDFANICSTGGNNFPGTDLADCSFMASDIEQCQAKGKIVTLSLGGATAKVGFSSSSQASDFAHTIWNLFLGGSSSMRPFGSAVLDGVDLDIENGSNAFYNTFVNTLRSLAQNAKKRYYVTAAPQCPFPDAELGNALNSAFFDAVYVQFYNNFCETSAPSEFNMATWDNWAKTVSPNRDIKVYLGAPGSPGSAGDGFVSSGTLINVVKEAQQKYSSFGGVMLWDADSAQTNGRYQVTVKNAIQNGASSPNPGSTQNPTPTSTHPATTQTKPHSSSETQPPATTQAPTHTAAPSSSASSATSIPDPRWTARVKRPIAKRNLTVGHPTPRIPRRPSRLFKR
ncbi:glycoside hydrolase family 18 protein [Hypholoma sublateritium FD-334 SS-4]|uniref:chitinase n=1 Tax=Hypholoma sublateritium (strain FD-334 SS-4) TaxID=945553 RepID=A0A0D2Q371_HYPSF|nr:glycoside hydrolase family 18 protein [Hypholoma sublateritium FD-334 SS-4]